MKETAEKKLMKRSRISRKKVKENSIRLIFSMLFLFMILIPLCTTNLEKDKISEAENRKLSAFPKMHREDGTWNHEYTEEFEKWINDNIGFRSELVMQNAGIQFHLFHVLSNNSDMLLGPNGELNYADESMLRSYQHLDLMTKEDSRLLAEGFQIANDYLNLVGTHMYYYQCSDKHSVYPEYFPRTVLQHGDISRTDQIVQVLTKQTDVDVIYPKEELIRMKAECDTYSVWGDPAHWTPHGAYIGYQMLMETINGDYGNVYRVLGENDYTINVADKGSTLFGGIHKECMEEQFKINNPQAVLTNDKLTLFGDDVRHVFYTNENAGNDTRILILGDSYFRDYIVDDIAESFYETVLIWGDYAGDGGLETLVTEYAPDILLVENAERCDRTEMFASEALTLKEALEILQSEVVEDEDFNESEVTEQEEAIVSEVGELEEAIVSEVTEQDEKNVSEPEQRLGTPVSDPYDFTLCFAGDVNLAENYGTTDKIDTSPNGIFDCIDSEMVSVMQSADYMVLNNEFTYSDRGAPLEGKAYTFRASPERVNILNQLGVDAVYLANNHVYDYGPDAMEDTFSTLENAGIPYFGAGMNLEKATAPLYIELEGKKIALVAASRAEKFKMTPQATETSPGILRCYDTALFDEAIREADQNADYTIAVVHWGTEYSTELETVQVQTAREYIEAGADAIIGAHSHCLQGLEYVDGVPVVYSLGNYWFNGKTLDTMLACLRFYGDETGEHLELKLVPGVQENWTTRSVVNGNEARRIFDALERISKDITIEDDGVVLQK